jgi:hypothetical protein
MHVLLFCSNLVRRDSMTGGYVVPFQCKSRNAIVCRQANPDIEHVLILVMFVVVLLCSFVKGLQHSYKDS